MEYLAFTRDRPTFERGCDRRGDFTVWFRGAARDYGVTEEQAKRVLYDAVMGSSSRLVITSLSPELPATQGMTFGEYLQKMGEKFMPAAESIQMEAEYRDWKQGKHEDVQNYVNAKYELFRAQAVNVVQIERWRIQIGDSDTKRLDGLVPVTPPIKEGPGYGQAGRRPRVPATAGEWEGADSEEEEAGQVGCEGQGTVKHHGGRPWGIPRGSTAIVTAASTTSKPMGRGSGRANGTCLWSDNGAIAALEFSQPSPGRRGTGAWQPGSGGPSRAAGERGGGAALGPLGH